MVRFGKCGKLSPRFIGPFDILERVGHCSIPVGFTAQHVRCPRGISLLPCSEGTLPDPAHVVDWGEIEVDTDETFD